MTKIGETIYGNKADLVRTHQNGNHKLFSGYYSGRTSKCCEKACRDAVRQIIHRCWSSTQPSCIRTLGTFVFCFALGVSVNAVGAPNVTDEDAPTPLGSQNSIDDEDGVPVVAIYRDRNRILMGRTYKSSNGDLMARDASHRYVGRYDTSNDITFDSRFRKVGHGNWLPSLIAGCGPNSSQAAN